MGCDPFVWLVGRAMFERATNRLKDFKCLLTLLMFRLKPALNSHTKTVGLVGDK